MRLRNHLKIGNTGSPTDKSLLRPQFHGAHCSHLKSLIYRYKDSTCLHNPLNLSLNAYQTASYCYGHTVALLRSLIAYSPVDTLCCLAAAAVSRHIALLKSDPNLWLIVIEKFVWLRKISFCFVEAF